VPTRQTCCWRALLREAKKIAVRISLGAGRLRLVRQLLTESLLLAALGGVIGILLAWSGLGVLTTPVGTTPAARRGPSILISRSCSSALGLRFVTGIVFGLAPCVQVVERQLAGGTQTRWSPEWTGQQLATPDADHQRNRVLVGPARWGWTVAAQLRAAAQRGQRILHRPRPDHGNLAFAGAIMADPKGRDQTTCSRCRSGISAGYRESVLLDSSPTCRSPEVRPTGVLPLKDDQEIQSIR